MGWEDAVTTIEDPVRVAVPSTVALQLAQNCTLATEGHEWSRANTDAAREVLSRGFGPVAVRALAERVAAGPDSAPGWAVLALPARLTDEQLQRAAAGLLAALGQPFNSIDQDGRLWIGRESVSTLDATSFGGVGSQRLHIDAPNVEAIPDYTSLVVLRPDPAGGGASLLGDLPAALALLSQDDRIALAQAVFYEGRTDGLRGVGGPRMPFPVVDDGPGGRWIRWAAKMLDDGRNAGRTGLLSRFAEALETVTVVVTLGRGQLLVLDQRRIAHGRTALGDQHGLSEGTRRWLMQAKVRGEATAPARIGDRDE
jgi:alpha-ketoglutarate-dependent taurine dioxygenase